MNICLRGAFRVVAAFIFFRPKLAECWQCASVGLVLYIWVKTCSRTVEQDSGFTWTKATAAQTQVQSLRSVLSKSKLARACYLCALSYRGVWS